MGELIFDNCGPFAWPQLALSALTVSLLLAYLIATWRGEIRPGQAPWDHTLAPLAPIATTVGLLGSVVGFIIAFSGFGEGLDVPRLTRGLSTAYWTTGAGIITSLVASGGAYLLTVLNRPHDGPRRKGAPS